MNKKTNRKGFTLAEVLIVVAIIVVLMSVGAIALFSHMRNMQKLEMDGQAKEIFVAAQNHLSMADSQGYMGTSNFGTDDDKAVPAEGVYIYYYIVNGASSFSADSTSVLNQMLPRASVDEAARLSGSYIIRYQKDPAQVLDVFYVSTTGRYTLEDGRGFGKDDYDNFMDFLDGEELDLKNYGDENAVVGYYGGTEVRNLTKGVTLLAPTVEIINGEQLIVKVTVPNGNSNGTDKPNLMTLVFTDSAGKELSIPLIKSNGTLVTANYARIRNVTVDGSNTEFTLIIDDVTSQKLHFAYNNAAGDISDFAGKGFTIGEDITVYAVAYNNSVLTNIAQSAPQDFNSLFASRSGQTAKIGYFRHLLNLDATVSGITSGEVTAAEQIANLTWTSSLGSITNSAGSGLTTSGKFYPVTPAASSFEYDGKDLSISDLVVEVSTGEAGLFTEFSSGSIKDLVLKDFTVKNTGSGNAGALAGSFGGTSISGVLAYNTTGATTIKDSEDKERELSIKNTGTGHAGGLVGKMTAGTVEKSAAAVYVSATGAGNAGGLIGLTAGAVTVSNSYSGGHTEDAKYRTLTTTGARTNFNVQSASGNAGGLIGAAAGTSLTVSTSYSTASAKADAENTGAGGLIGNTGAATVTINNSYATGLVLTGDKATTGAFVALSTSSITGAGNKFLSSLNASPSNLDSLGYTLTAATSSDTAFCLPKTPTDTRASAVPYDTALITGFDGKYSFPTIDQLNGITNSTASLKPGITDRHYGDWQMPTLEILHYTLENKDTLYTDITLKNTTEYVTLALYGEKSGKATVYLLELSDDKNTATIVDRGTLKKENVSGTEKTSINWIGKTTFASTKSTYDLPAVSVNSSVLTVTLDDITTAKKHFASVFPELIPGENVTLLLAGGECTWDELNSLRTETYSDDPNSGKIIALSDNSLFAKPRDLAAATVDYEDSTFNGYLAAFGTAEISNIRHLQNLDTPTSNVNGDSSLDQITKAKLTASIAWKESTEEKTWNGETVSASWESKSIYKYNSTSTRTAAGQFNGIYNISLTSFDGRLTEEDGSYRDMTIKGMTVGNTYGTGAGNAGLFTVVSSSLTIQHVRLDSPKIAAETAAAGAFVGSVTSGSVTLDTVLAEGYRFDGNLRTITGETDAGGLVGLKSGDGTLKINNSAASMLVKANSVFTETTDEESGAVTTTLTTPGAAGGLLGRLAGGTAEITGCYVGGHTNDGAYYANNAVADSGAAGRWNIISESGAAGGIIGATDSGSTAKISKTFNAASVFGDSGKAGGVVGVADGSFAAAEGDSDILHLVYVIAPVNSVGEIGYNKTAGTYSTVSGGMGSIFGSISGTVAPSRLFFLPDVYSQPMPVALGDSGNHSNITPIGLASGATLSSADWAALLGTAKLASLYESSDVTAPSNDILGIAHTGDRLEQETIPFDSKLSGREYPFAIWTAFNFDRVYGASETGTRYYYGDWQLMSHVTNIHLHIHYATILSDGDNETTDDVKEFYEDGTHTVEEIILQIPYTETSFDLLHAPVDDPEYYNYKFPSGGAYTLYQGDVSSISASTMLSTTYPLSDSGKRVALLAGDFQTINNKANYKDEDGDAYVEGEGDPHLHITLAVTCTIPQNKMYVLRFYDNKSDIPTTAYVPATDASPDASLVWDTGVLTTSTDAIKLISGLKATSGDFDISEVPVFEKTVGDVHYRFDGWYYPSGSTETCIIENVYNETDGTFSLAVVDTPSNTDSDITLGDDPDIPLYARYREIHKRKITVKFVDYAKKDETDTTVDKGIGVDDYVISFEGDRGFDKTISLPKGGGLKVKELAETYTGVTLDTDTATLAIEIDASKTESSDLTYTVYYEKTEEQPAAYVVLVSLLDTSEGSGTYSEGDSFVLQEIETATSNKGVVGPGAQPPAPTFATILNLYDVDSAEFEVSGVKYVRSDSDEWDDYSGKVTTTQYQDESNEQYTGEYEVSWVVVLECSRRTYPLVIDRNGGTYAQTMNNRPLLKVGSSISAYLTDNGYGNISRTHYVFNGWTKGDGTEIPAAMPAAETTVKAKWLGTPADFSIVFMLQPADFPAGVTPTSDDSYKYYTQIGAYTGSLTLKANAGTTVSFTEDDDDLVLSWLCDADPADTTTPDPTTVRYSALRSNISWSVSTDLLQFLHLNADLSQSQGLKNEIQEDGKSVVRVYLDRNEYTLRFDMYFATYSNASGEFRPLASGEKPSVLYGMVDGNYVELEYNDDTDEWSTPSKNENVRYNGDRYRERTGDYDSRYTYYGIVDGEIVELTYSTGGFRRADQYTYTLAGNPYDDKNHERYVYDNGLTKKNVKWDNGKWKSGNTYYDYGYRRNDYGTPDTPYNGAYGYYTLNTDGSFTQTTDTSARPIYGRTSTDGGFFLLTGSIGGVTGWSYNGEAYTGKRYTVGTDSQHNLGWIDGEMRTVSYSTNNRYWYYENNIVGGEYTGTKYAYHITSTPAGYKISSIWNASGNGYNNFFTDRTHSADPAKFESDASAPYKGNIHRYDQKVGSDSYSVYYYDITARYGQSIDTLWPAVCANQGSRDYPFIGWIQNNKSLYYIGNTTYVANQTSVKGIYKSVSDPLILIDWDSDGVFTARPTTRGNGIAHELHCRFMDDGTPHDYIYSYEFQDPDYPNDLTKYKKDVVAPFLVHSGADPDDQTCADFTGEGYNMPDTKYQYDSSGEVVVAKSGYSNSDKRTVDGVSVPGVVMVFRYTCKEWHLTLYDGNSPITGYDHVTRLNGQSLADVQALSDDLTPPSGKIFAGWYTNSAGKGDPYFKDSSRMPNGDLTLYAVWKDAPKTVTFDVVRDGVTMAALPAGQKQVSVSVDYNSSLSKTSGFAAADYNPSCEGYEFEGWFLGNSEFDFSAVITDSITLVARWTLEAQPQPIKYIYEYEDGAPVSPNKLFPEGGEVLEGQITLGKYFYYVPPMLDGYTVDPYPVLMSKVPQDWLDDHYNEEKNQYEIHFIYTQQNAPWDYKVDYCIKLSASDGTSQEFLLLSKKADKKAGQYKFEAFYDLPTELGGYYSFKECQIWRNGAPVGAASADPTVLLERGKGDTIKVYLEPDYEKMLPQVSSKTYNGAEQPIAYSLPDGLIAPTGMSLQPEISYYSGGTAITGAPVNAGMYGVKIKVMLEDDAGKQYLFWENKTPVAGKAPEVMYKIARCVITLKSPTVDYVFYKDSTNQGNPQITGNSSFQLNTIVKGEDYSLADPDSALDVKLSDFDIGYSADAFRQAKSHCQLDTETGKYTDEYTDYVFSAQLKASSGLSLDNVSIFKDYGKLYLWATYDDYDNYRKNILNPQD